MKKILAWTGEERDRKKISSHIQVLKNFMSKDDQCTYLWPVTPWRLVKADGF